MRGIPELSHDLNMITTDSISIDAILNDKEIEERKHKYLHKHINKI